MPLDFIMRFIIDEVCNDNNGTRKVYVNDDYVRRTLKKTKYVSEESTIQTESVTLNDGKNSAEQSTVQVVGDSETELAPEPEYKPNAEVKKIVANIESKYDQIVKQKDEIIENKNKEIKALKESQSIEDIPHQLIEDKVGPVKVQNLS